MAFLYSLTCLSIIFFSPYAIPKLKCASALLGFKSSTFLYCRISLSNKPFLPYETPKFSFNFGVSYGKKGLLDNKNLQYRKVLDLNPNSAEAHFNLGIAYNAGQNRKNDHRKV